MGRRPHGGSGHANGRRFWHIAHDDRPGGGTEEAPTARYGIEVDLDAYPQDSPKAALVSAVKAIDGRRFDYLAAHIADPAEVDKKVQELGGKFERYVKLVSDRYSDDPEALRQLRRFAAEGEVRAMAMPPPSRTRRSKAGKFFCAKSAGDGSSKIGKRQRRKNKRTTAGTEDTEAETQRRGRNCFFDILFSRCSSSVFWVPLWFVFLMTPIDLRSDTVTKPTPGMIAAMAAAEVGDDVYGEDPTVNRLEARVAALLGKESALFVPSGSMSNQIAVKTHTQPGDELICEEFCHIYNWEAGGPAFLSGVTSRTVRAKYGIIELDQLRDKIRPINDHMVRTRLVCLENTHNRGGGRIFPLEKVREISGWARANNLSMHLDGARLWNAIVATGVPAAEWGKHFDTISVCFSKGLGRRWVPRWPARRSSSRGHGGSQNLRRGHAASGRVGGGGHLRARSPRQSPGRGPSQRPVDRRGDC